MEIVDNKALRIRTRNPDKFRVIPKHIVMEVDGGYEVTVYWGLDEARVLKNLGVKNVPSPIERRYEWPGRYKPMSHQRVTAAFLTMHRRGFVFNDPGTAKTIASLWAADCLMARGDIRRCLIICPLSIMQSAWMGDIMNSIMHRSAIIAHHSKASRRIEMIQDNYEFVIINYDGLNLVADEIAADGRFDLVIVDECFAAGTLVATPHGDRRIEKLAVGERVLTSAGAKRIKRVVRNTSTNTVTVRTSDGKETTCTADHPFFTDAGWVTAANLVGRRLVRETELPNVSGRISSREEYTGTHTLEGYQRRDELLTILCTEAVPHTESGGQLLQPDTYGTTGQPNRDSTLGGIQSEYVGAAESEGSQTPRAGWEWDRHDRSGATGGGCTACMLGMELPRSVGATARRLSYELQDRLRKPEHQTRLGSGWTLPQYVGKEAAGSKEGGQAGGTWVVGVTHHEPGSVVDVYNLEVEDVPHYFANGNLVHNCNAYAMPSTKRWKSLAKIIRPDTFLWMMTGTPAAQSPVNAFGLAKLVNPSGVPNYMTAWRDKVMNKISTFKWSPKPNAKELVFDALQPAIRFSKADCLDLPPVLKTTREVAMTAQQQKYYNHLKNDMLVIAAGQTISAVNKAALVNKLLQVSAGGVYSEDGEVVEFDATPRMNLLLEILEETNRKVLIFATYRSSIDAIDTFLTKNGYKVGVIHGGIPATKRGELINRFQNTDQLDLMLMQPQATAHGITLTAADTVVFFGPLMSIELYLQCIARADRKGQTSDKVTVVHIQSSPVEKKMFAAMEGRVNEHALLTTMFDEEMGINA